MKGRPQYTTTNEQDRRRLTGELNGTGATPSTEWETSPEEFNRIVREVEEEEEKR